MSPARRVVNSVLSAVALTAELDKLKVYGERTDDEIARLGELRKELYGGSGVPFK